MIAKRSAPARGGSASLGLCRECEQKLVFLQSVVAAFAGAHADDVLHVIDEDLAVADMPRIERRACCFDDLFDGHLADDDLHLDFGQKVHIHLDAAVVLASR